MTEQPPRQTEIAKPRRVGGLQPHSATVAQRYTDHNVARGRGFVYGGRERVAMLREMMPPDPDLVLDLGCRDGALARALSFSESFVVGVDVDFRALLIAQNAGLRSCCADLWFRLPFQASSFDLVLAGEVIEHMPFPEQLLSEIARVLRHGGVVLGSIPNAFRLKNRLLFLAGADFEKDPTHLHHFSPKSINKLLGKHFTSIEIRPCVGRFVRLWPRMMANDLVWRACS
jgi:SAM-dependent methyltransferase